MAGIDAQFFVYIIASGIMAGTPILLASLGEILNQKSGVMNIGLEGMMLMGAIVGFIFGNKSGNRWIGLLAAMVACGILGAILSFLLIKLRANQVATGIAFLILCSGLASYIGKPWLGVVPADSFDKFKWESLHDLPLLRTLLQQDEMVVVALILAIVLWVLIYRTRLGLYIRAAGDAPAALDSAGVSVFKIRSGCLMVGSMIAGMGGAYLSMGYALQWVEGMTAGRGWLAIALVNFALWNPLNAIWGAYLFGMFHTLGLRLETLGLGVSPYFLRMIPYFLPIVILVLIQLINKRKANVTPKMLGVPYVRAENK